MIRRWIQKMMSLNKGIWGWKQLWTWVIGLCSGQGVGSGKSVTVPGPFWNSCLSILQTGGGRSVCPSPPHSSARARPKRRPGVFTLLSSPSTVSVAPRLTWLTRRNTFCSFMLLLTFFNFFFWLPTSPLKLETWPTRRRIKEHLCSQFEWKDMLNNILSYVHCLQQ